MSSIGEFLIKLFGGSDVDVYLGKTEPSNSPQPKQKTNILKSVGTILKNGFEGVFDPLNPYSYVKKRNEKRTQEELELKARKAERARLLSETFRNSKTSKFVKPDNSKYHYKTGSSAVLDRSISNIEKMKNPPGYTLKADSPPTPVPNRILKSDIDDPTYVPTISMGMTYLQNIKRALVTKQADPSQISETLFRKTFRDKNFSENDISTLWGEYNVWIREYKKTGKSGLLRTY